MNITIRPARAEDEEFLYAVYACTRAAEMALTPWTAAEQEAFLRMQSQAQRSHYALHYPNATYNLILADDRPAGRLFIKVFEAEIRIMDIALLPDFRGQGIGTHILNAILEEGRRLNLPVGIHVERFNPALRLYQRLGFHMAEDKGVYYFLKWQPEVTAHAETAG